MRLTTLIIVVALSACTKSQAPPTPTAVLAEAAKPVSYSALLRDDGQTWCAYKDAAEFQAEVSPCRESLVRARWRIHHSDGDQPGFK